MCYLSYIVLIMVYTRTDFRWINCYYNFFNEAVVKERCNLFLKVFLEETKRIVIFKKKLTTSIPREHENQWTNIQTSSYLISTNISMKHYSYSTPIIK